MKRWGMLIQLNEVENFTELLFSRYSISDFGRDALHHICRNSSMKSKGQASDLQLDSYWLSDLGQCNLFEFSDPCV